MIATEPENSQVIIAPIRCAVIATAALAISACSSGIPLSTDELDTTSTNASVDVPQVNIGQSSNTNTNTNTDANPDVENPTNGSDQTDEVNTSEPDTGAAIPTDGDTSVDTLGPDDVVSCSAPSLHIQERTLQLINEARSEARVCGTDAFDATSPLTWNSELQIAAIAHSADMAQHNFFSHTGSDGSSIGTRVDATGYEWRAVGENIAAGQNNATEAIDGWLESPGHCRNLMNPTFTEVAVSCVEDDGADYTRYWTNVFATPM